MEKIWLIGTDLMGVEYAKVLIALNVDFLAIGRGSENVLEFERQTMHPAIQGSLKNFLESKPETPAVVIVAVGVEMLAQTTQLLQDYGIKKILHIARTRDSLENFYVPMCQSSLNQKPTYSLFTVIIPTYNRPEYLKRILSYYLSFGIKIIVVDASDEIFPYLSFYGNQLEYMHTPNKNIIERVNEISSLICTPYVFLCADDDFIIPDAVNKVIAFLEENPNYAIGEGYIIHFYDKNNDLMCIPSNKDMLGENISEDSPSKRILHLMNNFIAVCYSVYRTDIFKKMYKSMVFGNKILIKQPYLHELYSSIYPLIEGKLIVLPLLYQVRESILNSAGSTSANIKYIVSNKKYRKEYNECITLLAAHLSKTEGIPFGNAKNIIEESIMRYLNNIYPKYYTIKKRIIPEIKYRLKMIIKYPIKVFLKIVGLYDYTKKTVDNHRLKNSPVVNSFMPVDLLAKKDIEHWNKIREYIIQSNVSKR